MDVFYGIAAVISALASLVAAIRSNKAAAHSSSAVAELRVLNKASLPPVTNLTIGEEQRK